MSCSGLHCAGCGGGAGVPAGALFALEGGAWVAAHLAEVAVISATCGALAVAAVVALMRWGDRRGAGHAAGRPLLITRADAAPVLTATVMPQPVRGTQPAIENHYHIHFDPADREAARIIRTALPGTAGDDTTERR